jgi:hypothetical protein
MEKLDVFIFLLFLTLSINIGMAFAFSYSSTSAVNTCNVFYISHCFGNLSGSYVYLGLNLTPVINFFVWILDALTLVSSLFLLSFAVPYLPTFLLVFLDTIDGLIITLMVLTIIPFLF